MAARPRSQFESAMTGNAGLSYAMWQLSRRGWHVLPTIRNARGSDLIVTDSDETIFFGVQSKALGKRHAVPLGRDIEGLRSGMVDHHHSRKFRPTDLFCHAHG